MKSWDSFYKFSDTIEEFMPSQGEGDTQASQAATAINKLIYKFFNDGDVYDNSYYLEGWANDLSSYANWLYKYIPSCRAILDRIDSCYNTDDYTEILYDLAECIIEDEELLYDLDQKSASDSIYDCNGPFKFVDWSEDEEEDWSYDDEEDWEDEE